jgi:uncharacterized protein (TIGR02391 family)
VTPKRFRFKGIPHTKNFVMISGTPVYTFRTGKDTKEALKAKIFYMWYHVPTKERLRVSRQQNKEIRMSVIKAVFPDPEVAIQLGPEELAVPLLETLCRYEEGRGNNMMHPDNFINRGHLGDYAGKYLDQILKAMIEAWMWLEHEGLIAPQPEQISLGWCYITKRGHKFRETGDVHKFKAANLFPDNIFDSILASKARSLFLRGDYDTAVFQAFKEVEVRVRNLAGFGAENYGVDLMRAAFNPVHGPLTDKAQVKAEKEGIMYLFSGAILSFKNPSSHRDVNFDDPAEVAELIMLADLLIRIAQRRKPSSE